jgi:hypothetical protein
VAATVATVSQAPRAALAAATGESAAVASNSVDGAGRWCDAPGF